MLYMLFTLKVRTLSQHFFCITFALHLHFANVYSYSIAIIAFTRIFSTQSHFQSMSVVIPKLWLQTQSSTKLQIPDDHAVKSLKTLWLHIEKVCSIQTWPYTKSETSSLHPICVGDRRADVSVGWFIHRASWRIYRPTPRRVCRYMLSLFRSVPVASTINTA